jgi:type V secretory pathway adhesin AidA
MPLTRITSQLISIPSNYPLTGSLNGTASYAVTSSYLADGSQILTDNRTVAFSSSFTTTQMQALIDAQPKNLSGKNLTFQFADGTYSLTSALQFRSFGNGVIIIYGNSANNNSNQAKNVTVTGASGATAIYVSNCPYVTVRYLRINHSGTDSRALNCDFCRIVTEYCSFVWTTANTTSGINFYLEHGAGIISSCNFAYGQFHIASAISAILTSTSHSTTNNAAYGLMADSGYIIKRAGSQPGGTTAQLAQNGGMIT